MSYVAGSVEADFGEGVEQVMIDALRKQGYLVIHRAQWTGPKNTAAMVEGVDGKKFILPDADASMHGHSCIVDAKAKTVPNFFRIRNRFEHGVEINPLYCYMRCAYEFNKPVAIILFEQDSGKWLITNPERMLINHIKDKSFNFISYDEDNRGMAQGMGQFRSLLNVPVDMFQEIDINNVDLREHATRVKLL